MSANSIEQIRAGYRPERIVTLFLGESAPASGKFFYTGDTQMARYFRKAFNDPDDFLNWFKIQGFYLDDLVLEPVNNQRAARRAELCQAAVSDLAERLARYEPRAVVVVMKGIARYVHDAIAMTGITVPTYIVSFPGNGQQGRFLNEMAQIIPKLPRNDRSL